MNISRAELVAEEHPLTHEVQSVPTTFFTLTPSEQMLYNTFRGKRDDLEGVVINMTGKERQEREDEIRDLFVRLVNPMIAQTGVNIIYCAAGYGDDGLTIVHSPLYTLFDDNDPFDVGLKVNYWFSTKGDVLSCNTNLQYHAEGSISKSPHRQLVYDLFNRASSDEQNGMTVPLVSIRGHFMAFASSAFAMPLIGSIRELLDVIGPEAMKELNVLFREYRKQVSDGEYSDTTTQQKVFREAYDRKIEIELMRTGCIGQNLTLAK